MINKAPFSFGDFALWERRIDAARDPGNWKIVVIDGAVPEPLDSHGNRIPGSASPVRNCQAAVFHPPTGIIVKCFKMFSIENRPGALDVAMREYYPDFPWCIQDDLNEADGKAFDAAVRRVASREMKTLPHFGGWLALPEPAKDEAHASV